MKTYEYRGITVVWQEQSNTWYCHPGNEVGNGRRFSTKKEAEAYIDWYWDY